MSGAVALAEVLGIAGHRPGPMSPMTLMSEVEKGLPLSALDRVVRSLSPGEGSFAFRLVPRATLARRRSRDVTFPGAGSRLTPEEGARVARLAEVWAFACEVWGSEEAARDFLFRPHSLLEGRCPVDVVLANEFGRPLVDGILGRLKYGSAA